ncbi:hypothetical protein HELRODRAFT_170247 [Helobdella robusta]|uniref:Peptidase S1 domain-containing protein n=1 Tax=Helobdella robusta TaxID=6412 RepID=T1F2T9_HELRO|nr:hypothetical protein HELRODRAFT_170247 [Helobdella robusta]ESO07709.1 hypothetical protein HELRODRAFT_170247 [Helobdella robusta]
MAVLMKDCERIAGYSASSNICIGTHRGHGHSNICVGDSGGPFMCKSLAKDKWTIFGIHSFVAGYKLDWGWANYGHRVTTDKYVVSELCQASVDTSVFYYINFITETISS